MRIHLGHHFYGAGNLGDDFMLAGFLGAMRSLAPGATYTACAPFALGPLQRRFPAVAWWPYDDAARGQCIRECDVWLGLGGSPFQSALSRWFVDHLVGEAERCERELKPMFFAGIGVQTSHELHDPAVRRLCARAAGIWTRDSASAQSIRGLPVPPPLVEAAADFAHVLFRDSPPPAASPGRLTLVANFDYGAWPGQAACLRAVRALGPGERVWLAQESRDLPGAERALFSGLAPEEQARWQLISPERPGAPLTEVLGRWPSGQWLVTSRYHAALAGAWAGSKIVVLSTNDKLRAAARDFRLPALSPSADEPTVTRALHEALAVPPPHLLAEQAYAACAAFVQEAACQARK